MRGGARPISRGPAQEFRVGHMTWVVYPEHEGGPWMQFCFDGPAVNGVQPRHVLVDTPIVAGIAAQMEAVAAVLRPLEIAP